MARSYRPQYTESPLSRALQGALAVWTGQQQGKADRRAQDDAEAQQQQQRLLSVLPQLQRQEESAFNNQIGALDDLIRDPNLDPTSRTGLIQQKSQAQSAYQPTNYTGYATQILTRKRGDKTPISTPPPPQQFAPLAPAHPLKYTDPLQKSAAAAMAQNLDSARVQALQDGDGATAAEIENYQADLVSGKTTPELLKPKIVEIYSRFQAKGKRKERLGQAKTEAAELSDLLAKGVVLKEDENATNAIIGELQTATDADVEDILARARAHRKKLRLQPSPSERNAALVNDRIIKQNEAEAKAREEREAVNTNETLLTRIDTARKQGNLPLLRGMIEQQATLARKYPGAVRPFLDGYGDDPQEVRRTRAVFKGIPNALGEEDYWEPETPEEVKARKERSLADLLEDPKAKAKQASEAQKALWGVFKSGRWASLSEDTRASIIDQLGEISAMTDSSLILPPGLKDVNLTPREEEAKRRWEITNQRAHDKALMAKEMHTKRLDALDRRIKIADQQIAGTYAPQKGARYSSAELAATKAAAANLRFVRDQYAEALKNPNHEGGKTPERWAQLVDEAEQELNATIKDPATAVEKVTSQTIGRGPVQRRPAAAAASPAKVRVKVGGRTFSLTPEQARARGIAF